MPGRLIRQFALLALVVTTIGCDRVTKHMAATTLAGEPGVSFLSDTVRLQYAENPGGFLSLGAGLPPGVRTAIFTFAMGLLLVVLVAAAIRHGIEGWPLLGVCLFAAGASSNWIDRVTRGSVIDFINVGLGPVRTGIFNVADVAIMLGAAILLVVHFRSPDDGMPQPSARMPDDTHE